MEVFVQIKVGGDRWIFMPSHPADNVSYKFSWKVG